MKQERTYRTFTHRDAVFRICCSHLDAVTAEIVRQRQAIATFEAQVASLIAQDLAGQRFYGSEDGRTWREIEPPSEKSGVSAPTTW